MVGTLINAAGIIAGGILGLTVTKPLSTHSQRRLKVLLGAFSVYIGLSMTWTSLHGSFLQILKQFCIVMLALMLGKFTGHLLRLQKGANHLGRFAKERFAAAQSAPHARVSEGFVTCTILFCVAPLAVLGPLQEGLKGEVKTLAIKTVMDGLATMAFAQTFGWGVVLSVLPVVAYQGTLTLGAKALAPILENHALLDPVSATAGLVVFSVALVILELRKVELTNYLPSLVYAPLLTWLFH